MGAKRCAQGTDVLGLEKELNQFHEMLKEHNLSTEEIKDIMKPLRNLAYKGYVYKFFRLCRIAMIQVLPYWNWEKLAGERCLLRGHQQVNEIKNFDCTLCESINSIPVEKEIDPDILSEIYLDINVPVLISDGTKNWPFFNVRNMTEKIIKSNLLSRSFPCEMMTNMISSPIDVTRVLKKTDKFRKWFLHFQNCEIDAAKAFRVFTPRPYFLKPEISPIQYSWLLMSKNYKFPMYKLINLSEKVTMVGQVDGSTYVRLIPRKNCFKKCPVIETKLEKGEVIVFGTLWDFEYKPFENASNIAVILEA